MPMPLHAGLTSEEQMAIFDPPPPRTRKVVFATNIAEASVTIDGKFDARSMHEFANFSFSRHSLRHRLWICEGEPRASLCLLNVVSPVIQLRVFNPVTGMDILRIAPTSRASANQRAGRAGRTSSGKCLRLYPETAFSSLTSSTPPEICRSDVALFILQLKALGIDNILRFDFMTPPPARMLERGLEFLFSLGALDDNGRLTTGLGARMAELPVDPAMAKIVGPGP
jgi:ATP-dependent RNA helicase DDX35